jgi:DTW domain-containing protein YfiP
MYYRIPWLQTLPTYSISPTRKSNYRIRKQPNERCLSTAECVSEALIALEGEESGAGRLVEAFDAMIDDQLDAEKSAFERGARERM